jgi:hypothetical protein
MIALLDGRQTGTYPETGLWEDPNSVSNVLIKSQPAMAEAPASDRIAFA